VPEGGTPANTPIQVATDGQLSGREKFMAFVMFILGLALIVGGLWSFGNAKPSEDGTNPFAFKSKEKVVEEPGAANTGGGTKTTTETDYSDTVMVFVLTIGAGLLFTAALYPRIKEISLGALKVTTRDPTEKQQQAKEIAKKAAEEKVKDTDTPIPATQAGAVSVAAAAIAEKDVLNLVLAGASVDDLPVEEIGTRAANRAVKQTLAG
jgi:hypothetical protein